MVKPAFVATLVAVGLVLVVVTGESGAQQFAVDFTKTFECGSSGNCIRHPNPVEPVAYNLQNVRSVVWWGWTGNPADATLHFEVIVGP
jgi:hypothetical protein